MKIVQKRIEDIHPYKNNPRVISDDAVEKVANSIKSFGFKVPIIIDKDGTVVTGHTRLKAAEKIGMKEVPCIVAGDLTPEQIKAFRLADNKVSEFSEWDFNLLDAELCNLADFDMRSFGFEAETISPDGFGEDFSLNDEEQHLKSMSLCFTQDQYDLIEKQIDKVSDGVIEKYGDKNKVSNCIYEVISQWAELKK